MEKAILEVKHLVKKYGDFTAVNRISFSLDKSEVVGLLGPNGAGKTTTIQILLGITQATNGEIRYFGKDFYQNRQYCLQRINSASAYNSLQGRLTVFENLKVFAGLYELKNPDKKIQELSEKLEIEETLNQQFWTLSSGQRTRVNLVKSLLNEPQLILMDEPTASLDPDIADKVLTLIETLREEKNLSILYTSHNMDEVARVCDRVIFLNHGKIVAMDTPLGLTKRVKNTKVKITFDGKRETVESYLKEKEMGFNFPRKQVVEVVIEEERIPKVLFGLSKTGIWLTDIDIKKPDLEDVFLNFARGKNVFHKD